MSYHHLTMDERNVIYRMQFQGYSQAEIARCLGRHRSTISRECKRNGNVEGRYDPGNAQTLAHSRRRAHLRSPKTGDRGLMAYVAERLKAYWSPEQIAGRLDACAPQALRGKAISHTTIYRWIWSDPQRTRQFRPFLRIARTCLHASHEKITVVFLRMLGTAHTSFAKLKVGHAHNHSVLILSPPLHKNCLSPVHALIDANTPSTSHTRVEMTQDVGLLT